MPSIRSDSDSATRGKAMSSAINALNICLFLTAAAFICLFYTYFISFIYHFGGIFSASQVAYQVGLSLLIVNSSINPFVYLLRYREFQQEITKLFSCCFKATPRIENNHSEVTGVGSSQQVSSKI